MSNVVGYRLDLLTGKLNSVYQHLRTQLRTSFLPIVHQMPLARLWFVSLGFFDAPYCWRNPAAGNVIYWRGNISVHSLALIPRFLVSTRCQFPISDVYHFFHCTRLFLGRIEFKPSTVHANEFVSSIAGKLDEEVCKSDKWWQWITGAILNSWSLNLFIYQQNRLSHFTSNILPIFTNTLYHYADKLKMTTPNRVIGFNIENAILAGLAAAPFLLSATVRIYKIEMRGVTLCASTLRKKGNNMPRK